MAKEENDDLECFDDKKAIEYIQKNRWKKAYSRQRPQETPWAA